MSYVKRLEIIIKVKLIKNHVTLREKLARVAKKHR